MSAYKYMNYYIADGFAEDCDALIQKYLKTESMSFQVFCNIWKDMKFTDVFKGRLSKAEVAELTEEMIIIAKQYMVAPSNNFEESSAGLFLLYAIVHTQPFEKFAPVRFIPEDVDCIMLMKEEATKKLRWDVLYILGSLLIDGPSEFHIAQRPYGMDRPMRKYFEDKLSIQNEVYHKGVLHKHNEETEALRDLSLAMRKYTTTKSFLPTEVTSQLRSYIDDKLSDEMSRTLKILVGEEMAPKEISEQDRLDVRKAIRARAMKTIVDKLKFLDSVNLQEKSDTEDSQISEEDDIKIPEDPSPRKHSSQRRLSKRRARKRLPSNTELTRAPKVTKVVKKFRYSPRRSNKNNIILDRSKDDTVDLDLDKFI